MVAGIKNFPSRLPFERDFVGRKDVVGYVVCHEFDIDGLGLLVNEFSVLRKVNHPQSLILRQALVEKELHRRRGPAKSVREEMHTSERCKELVHIQHASISCWCLENLRQDTGSITAEHYRNTWKEFSIFGIIHLASFFGN